MAIDASGLIPETFSTELVTAAAYESAALRMGRRIPMPAGATKVPILSSIPEAEFVGVGGRKPYTDLEFGTYTLQAEEVATTTGIARAYLDDSAIPLWNAIRPELASAIARRIDGAAIFGDRAPASFPPGGLVGGITPSPGSDAIDKVNNAMMDVEDNGVAPTGHAANLAAKGAFRGIRDNSGAFLMQDATTQGQLGSLFGLPISWLANFGNADIDFVTGDWTKLAVGIRQDIRYEISEDGVIVDGAGKVIVSAFQDDMVLMRVYMRLGVTLLPALRVEDDGTVAKVSAFAGAKIGRARPAGSGSPAVQANPSPTDPATAEVTADAPADPGTSGGGSATTTPATRRR